MSALGAGTWRKGDRIMSDAQADEINALIDFADDVARARELAGEIERGGMLGWKTKALAAEIRLLLAPERAA